MTSWSKRTFRPLAIGLFTGLLGLTASSSVTAAETESAIARGGRLYDKHFKENNTAKPDTDHASYPHKGGKYGKDASWRCKECHGWDYKGKDGAYASGGHATGIKGINGAAGKDPAAIVAILKDAQHGYTDKQLSAQDMNDLALFVSKGQIDTAKYVADKKAKGNAAKGEVYFNTLCAGCHGKDGKKVKDAPPIGSVADNAVEMLHKVMNGQPGEGMPALRALDPQIAVDIVSYLPQLPKQ
ncbi:MAG: c-type cytochrome [Betaproteobacteria bacterium]|nr:c-type cytochrome [Betaproteobacteria bacterium]